MLQHMPPYFVNVMQETNVPMVDSGSTTTDDVNVRGGKSKSRVHTALITLGTGCCFLLIIITAIAITVMFLLRYRAPHGTWTFTPTVCCSCGTTLTNLFLELGGQGHL